MKPYPFSLDGLPPPTTKRSRWWRFTERHLPRIVLYLMVAALVAVVLLPHVVVTVPSGYVGVLWKRFGNGTVLDPRQLRGEGLRGLLPWNQLFLYDLRLQSMTETYNAISGDGVSLICHDERPFSAAAQCHPRAASSGRARLPEFTSETWHRQSDPRGHG